MIKIIIFIAFIWFAFHNILFLPAFNNVKEEKVWNSRVLLPQLYWKHYSPYTLHKIINFKIWNTWFVVYLLMTSRPFLIIYYTTRHKRNNILPTITQRHVCFILEESMTISLDQRQKIFLIIKKGSKLVLYILNLFRLSRIKSYVKKCAE